MKKLKNVFIVMGVLFCGWVTFFVTPVQIEILFAALDGDMRTLEMIGEHSPIIGRFLIELENVGIVLIICIGAILAPVIFGWGIFRVLKYLSEDVEYSERKPAEIKVNLKKTKRRDTLKEQQYAQMIETAEEVTTADEEYCSSNSKNQLEWVREIFPDCKYVLDSEEKYLDWLIHNEKYEPKSDETAETAEVTT